MLQFFIDGYESAAQQISLVYYFLATNPHVQDRAFEEVKALADKLDVDLEAENINLVGEDVNELK